MNENNNLKKTKQNDTIIANKILPNDTKTYKLKCGRFQIILIHNEYISTKHSTSFLYNSQCFSPLVNHTLSS